VRHWPPLQKKLVRATGGWHYIETVWGRGYILRDPVGDNSSGGSQSKLAGIGID
jgi:hypothetical protein